MLFKEKKYEFNIEGRECSFSIGKFARKSEASVYATMGDSVVLASVNSAEAKEDAGYFPLMVDYVEKLYAAGLISSSRFNKRERFPTDDAVLKARLIDRSFRPRFPSDYRNEVQVIAKVLSYDPENDPLILTINAISAALLISEIPFDGPISGVRIGIENDELVPFYRDVDRVPNKEITPMNLVLAGDGEKFSNIDADMFEVEEDKILEGMEYSLELMNDWIKHQNEFKKVVLEDSEGTSEEHDYLSFAAPKELVTQIKEDYEDEIIAELKDGVDAEESEVLKEMYEKEGYEGEYTKDVMKEAYTKASKYYTRKIVKDEGVRIDGRAFDEVRELNSEVNILPRVHGTGLFTRGMTQVLSLSVLDSISNKQLIEDMTGEDTRRYIHYYVDAPFSYGSVGRLRYNPSRRGVGHGALAEKALIPVLPSVDDFPYMMMVASEIMSENGSSSMGSICGSTLSLLDAGVPLKAPVAGIALGIIIDENDEGELNYDDYQVLTDMQALEDFYGFMDFKVAGTREGVTAIQMDTKASGLPLDVFRKGFEMAKKARLEILDNMESSIGRPAEMSEYAPRVEKVTIPVDKIGDLIGPGGKNIKELTERTDTDINIEENGEVMIYGISEEGVEEAKKAIDDITFIPDVGSTYEGKVVRIENYGAFVELAPGTVGLLHISKIAEDKYIKNIRKHIEMDDMIKVKVVGLEDDGKIKLAKV